jgi:hypothetical protein
VRSSRDVEVGDANQGHWRLALDLAKLLRCSSTIERRRRSGFKAAAAPGFTGGSAQGLGRLGISR